MADYYILRKGNGYTECVDETDNEDNAQFLLGEYRLADPAGIYSMDTNLPPGVDH